MQLLPSKFLFYTTFGWSVTTVAAMGQVAIGSPSGSAEALGPTPTSGSYVSGKPQAAPLASIASALAKPGALWQSGPVAVRPHFSYEVVHGTGILRLLGSDEKVTMQTLSPGVLVDVGSRASVDYTLSHKWYSSRKLSDSTDHNVWLRGGAAIDQWKFGVNGNYGTNTSVMAETGELTRDDTYATTGDVSYQLGHHSELELNLSHSDRSARPVAMNTLWQGSDWVLWNATTWLRYHVSKDLSVAIGVGAGYDEIKDSPDMEHYRPLFQFNWKPTKKITLTSEVGFERRRTLSRPARSETNSLYSASVSYTPFAPTRLTLTAERGVSPSYFSRQSTQTDSWSASLEQRFLRKLFFSANISQSRNAYTSTIVSATSNRGDRNESYGLRLSTAILQKGTVAVFYRKSRNHSSMVLYQYDSDQVGASLTYRF